MNWEKVFLRQGSPPLPFFQDWNEMDDAGGMMTDYPHSTTSHTWEKEDFTNEI